MAQDQYALPREIFPCDDVNLPDFRYLNNDFAPVKHPFKDAFNIESYNSMWLDESIPVTKPSLQSICTESLPNLGIIALSRPPVASPATPLVTASPTPPTVPRPDTVDEMDSNTHDNDSDCIETTAICTETPLHNPLPLLSMLTDFDDSKTNLCFISYRGAGTLRPKWYLIEIRKESKDDAEKGELFVDFFRKHPDDNKKKDNVSRY